MKKWLKLSLKIVITVICIWYVSTKINFSEAGDALRNSRWIILLPALLAFILSKVFSAIRLNIYFRNIRLYLPSVVNLRLYWLGMFYNLFLPGSISGDAYKVILLTKRYGVAYRKTTSAVLLDRLSGLAGLGIILAGYGMIALKDDLLTVIVTGASILGVVILYLITRFWLKDFLPSFFSTLAWGIVVQGMQVICIYFIMLALNIQSNQDEYILLFLVSSMVSVLPLTIGGLGIREVVFLEGAKYFALENEQAVVISILFYLVTLLTSAWGAVYVFREPLSNNAGR